MSEINQINLAAELQFTCEVDNIKAMRAIFGDICGPLFIYLLCYYPRDSNSMIIHSIKIVQCDKDTVHSWLIHSGSVTAD